MSVSIMTNTFEARVRQDHTFECQGPSGRTLLRPESVRITLLDVSVYYDEHFWMSESVLSMGGPGFKSWPSHTSDVKVKTGLLVTALSHA